LLIPASPVRVLIRTAPCNHDDEHYILITAEPPGDDLSARAPANVAVVIDKSGSMAAAATVTPDGDDGGETYGLSLLDVVKHATSTVAETLEGGDRLSVVSFDSKANVESEMTAMHRDGKDQARDIAASLQPGSTTNLWDGLATGLDVLRDGGSANAHSALMVLTDGVPNVVPPRGHENMLQRYLDTHGHVASISTFGFGCSLDSKLLSSLARGGGGAYAFIPDASFVGTAFVHALANTLSTFLSQAELKIEVEDGASIRGAARASHLEVTSWGGVAPIGPIRYGQARNLLLRAKLPAGSTLRASLTDGSGVVVASSDVVDDTSGRVLPGSVEALQIDEQVHRHQLLQTIGFALETCEGGDARHRRGTAAPSGPDLAAAEARRLALSRSIATTSKAYKEGLLGAPPLSSPFLSSLAADVDGQVQEALSRRDWWLRWGRHWLRSFGSAHSREECNNFKDASVQSYGGSLFKTERDRADAIFLRLPPPTPSIPLSSVWRSGVQVTQTRTQLTSMGRYHDSSRPCFHAGSAVALADSTHMLIRDLAKGDRVAIAGGGSARVCCVVRTACPWGHADLVTLPGGLRVTPWHPVRLPGEAAWRFPARDVSSAVRDYTTPCEALYSVLLESGHTLLIDGYECVGLGHGITDDPVASHHFFGQEGAVRASLRAMEGWCTGVVDLDPHHPVERDVTSGLVSGLREGCALPPRRERMSTTPDAMKQLHQASGWTPDPQHVRPTEAVHAQKQFALASIAASWQSVADWVCNEIFGTSTHRAHDGRRVAERPVAGRAVLAPQPFPYELPVGTWHLVLWMAESQGARAWTDEQITASIAAAVDKCGGGEFVWYRNPKPSVLDAHLAHVQVFWRPPRPTVGRSNEPWTTVPAGAHCCALEARLSSAQLQGCAS
jgi:hypothetical protein